jgi:hypothetical protein
MHRYITKNNNNDDDVFNGRSITTVYSKAYRGWLPNTDDVSLTR